MAEEKAVDGPAFPAISGTPGGVHVAFGVIRLAAGAGWGGHHTGFPMVPVIG
ncbi:MAG: hypothetical protein QM742_15145 [Aquabacterium sp.]